MKKKCGKFVEPLSGSLLEAVDGLAQLTNMIGLLSVNKSEWLHHIDFIQKIIM